MGVACDRLLRPLSTCEEDERVFCGCDLRAFLLATRAHRAQGQATGGLAGAVTIEVTMSSRGFQLAMAIQAH